MDMTKDEKYKFLENVDLRNTEFQIRIADFGLSKAVNEKEGKC